MTRKVISDVIYGTIISNFTIREYFDDSHCNAIYTRLFREYPEIRISLSSLSNSVKGKDIDYDKTIVNIIVKLNNYHKFTNVYTDCYISENSIIVVYNNKINDVINSYKLLHEQLLDNEHYNCSFYCSKEIFDSLVNEETIVYKDTSIKCINYVVYSQSGFGTNSMIVNKPSCDVLDNYNDDLPYEKIKDIINSKSSGLIIMNGIPGSGKSYLLRKLIYETDQKFIFLDASCFNYITDSSFIQLLTEYKDCVFILEDCETLLEDRGLGNERLSSLLNISDGILGDSLNLKFICTFNSDLTRIDKALLRKGRLKLKYEFKKLTVDKVKNLATKLGKNIENPTEMALCDIYNYGEEVNNEQVNRPNKIGF